MVLIDRFPWKKRQTGFVLAHIGILSLLAGGFITKHFGLDGSLRFKEGEKTRWFSVQDMEIKIYSSYDGENFQLIHEEAFDMFSIRPSQKKPYIIKAGGEEFSIHSYIPFALGSARFVPVEKQAKAIGGPALRFHLKGSMASVTEWIALKSVNQTEKRTEDQTEKRTEDQTENQIGERSTSLHIGPALIRLTTDKSLRPKSNKELILYADGEKLFYSPPLFPAAASAATSSAASSAVSPSTSLKHPATSKNRGISKNGEALKNQTALPPLLPLPRGKAFPTGWMDFQFRLLEFLPKAKKEFTFKAIDRPKDKSLKVLHVRHRGNNAWLGENSYVSFFTKDRVYAISFLNQSYDLGFDIELIDFRIKTYQGVTKAKSYESEVRYMGKTALISMNQPLKEGGWTLYQSSFELPENSSSQEEAEVSILSVNKDPGRPIKYFGSSLIVAGISLLFYRRKIGKKPAGLL